MCSTLFIYLFAELRYREHISLCSFWGNPICRLSLLSSSFTAVLNHARIWECNWNSLKTNLFTYRIDNNYLKRSSSNAWSWPALVGMQGGCERWLWDVCNTLKPNCGASHWSTVYLCQAWPASCRCRARLASPRHHCCTPWRGFLLQTLLSDGSNGPFHSPDSKGHLYW